MNQMRSIFTRFGRCKLASSNHIVRYFASQEQIIERLDNRALIQIHGQDSSEFLQGLITNDMKHFEDGNASIYALFLNIKGRLMFDTLIYKIQDNNLFYLECDSRVTGAMHKHLTMYKLRKKVEIKLLKEEMNVWAVFNPSISAQAPEKNQDTKLEGQIFPCGIQYNKSRKIIDKILIYEDPRLAQLGLRVLTQNDVNSEEIAKRLGVSSDKLNIKSSCYPTHRYKLGIGEGIQDFPLGKALPLEINADYLHGVSFHKGCYIGQELTARTYHTGVVRKRLMPIVMSQNIENAFEYDEKICDENGQVVGKFRAKDNIYGIALMRIAEALKAKSLLMKDIPLKIIKPFWWMPESHKESLFSAKSAE